MKALTPAAEAQLAARVFALGFLCGAVRSAPVPAPVVIASRRSLPARDCRGRFVARAVASPAVAIAAMPAAAPKVQCVRRMPARDSRGRFVPNAAVDAPSWYVMSVDAYRIPGEAPVLQAAPAAPLALADQAPRSAPAAHKRQWITLKGLESALIVLFVILVSSLYAAHVAPANGRMR